MPVRTAVMDPELEPDPARRTLPLIAEVLGYLGAVIAISAGFVALRHVWPEIPPSGVLAFAAVAAAGLIVAGAVLPRRPEPAFGRLRAVLWLLATVAAGGFFAVLTGRILDLSGGSAALSAEAGWLVCAIPLWLRHRSVLQQLAMFAGAVALVGTGLDQFDPRVTNNGVGLAVWALCAIWALAAYLGYLEPATAGLAAGSVGAMVGSALMNDLAGQALLLATVVALLAVGVVTRRVLLIGLGAAGSLWAIPAAADRYLPGSLAAPLAVAIVGLVLLGIALWLARTRRRV
jgi:hypothetical protein